MQPMVLSMSHVSLALLVLLAGCAEVYTPVGSGADAEVEGRGGTAVAPAPPEGATDGAGGAAPPSKPVGPDDTRPERVDPTAPEEIPMADAGAPPSGRDEPVEPGPADPGSEPPPPAPPTQAPPADAGPCQGIDFIGECQGSLLRYCDNGVLVVWDCAWSGEPCGWVDASTGYDCGGRGAGPEGGGDDPPPDPSPSPVPPGSCGTAEEARVVDLVNASRARNGLGALACDPAAVQAARLHSQDQCRRGYMGHDGSDGSDPGDRMRRQGGVFSGWGENVAYGASTPEGVHDMWMNSPGHHRNIMGAFDRIGVGLDVCGGTYYWTETFMN
jgi:hypothetical protein